jgi:hypothetical protein
MVIIRTQPYIECTVRISILLSDSHYVQIAFKINIDMYTNIGYVSSSLTPKPGPMNHDSAQKTWELHICQGLEFI